MRQFIVVLLILAHWMLSDASDNSSLTDISDSTNWAAELDNELSVGTESENEGRRLWYGSRRRRRRHACGGDAVPTCGSFHSHIPSPKACVPDLVKEVQDQGDGAYSMTKVMEEEGKDVINMLVSAGLDELGPVGSIIGNIAFGFVGNLFGTFFPKPKKQSGCASALPGSQGACIWNEIYNQTRKFVGEELSQAEVEDLTAAFQGAHTRLSVALKLVTKYPNGTMEYVPTGAWNKIVYLHNWMQGYNSHFYEEIVRGKAVELLVHFADMHIWIMQTLFLSGVEILGVQYRTSNFLRLFQSQIESYVNHTTLQVAYAKSNRLKYIPQEVTFTNPTETGSCKPRHATAKDTFPKCPWTLDTYIQACGEECTTVAGPVGMEQQCGYKPCASCNLEGAAEQALKEHKQAVEDQQNAYWNKYVLDRIPAWKNTSKFMATLPLLKPPVV